LSAQASADELNGMVVAARIRRTIRIARLIRMAKSSFHLAIKGALHTRVYPTLMLNRGALRLMQNIHQQAQRFGTGYFTSTA
jgi:hypothetical protein